MFNTKKQLIVTGSIIASLLVGLIIYFSLMFSGVINLAERNLIFSSGSAEIKYDGNTVLTNRQYELLSGSLYSGHRAQVDFLSSLDTVGEVDNLFIVTIYDQNDKPVTSKYEINYIYGTLKISNIDLTIKTDSSTKTYDGTPLTNDGWWLTAGKVLDGHSLDIEVYSENDSVGVVENKFHGSVFDREGNDVTKYYNFVENYGELTVNPMNISGRTFSASKTYDGIPLKDSGYELYTELLDGHKLDAETVGEQLVPGISPNELAYTIKDQDNKDVTHYYQLNIQYGELHVSLANFYFNTESDEKTYDGLELKCEVYIYSGLVDGHRFVETNDSVITDVGVEENTVTVKILDEDDEDVSDRYLIHYKYGDLTIHPKDITIITDTDAKTYDGYPLQCTDNIEIIGLIDGYLPVMGPPKSIVDVGVVKNEIIYTIIKDDEIVTDNFNITYEYGTLTITKMIVNIATPSINTIYTSEEISFRDLTNNIIQSDKIVDEFTSDLVESGLGAGTYPNVGFVVFSDNDKELNYNITYTYGTITIEKVSVLIQTSSSTYIYDGEPYSYPHHTASVYPEIKEGSELYQISELYEISDFVSVIEVGIYYNTATIKLTDPANFSLTYIWGGITITDETKDGIIITPLDIKVPVGAPVNASTFYATDANLKGLEAFGPDYRYEAEISGYLASKGSTTTKIVSFALYYKTNPVPVAQMINGQIESDDFEIFVEDGILVMTDVTVTVSSNPYEKYFDGKELTLDSSQYEKNIDGDGTDDYYIEVIGSITNVGSIKPVVKVYNGDKIDVTQYCIIDNQLGELTILKHDISLDLDDILIPALTDLSTLEEILITKSIDGVTYQITVNFYGLADEYEMVRTEINSSNSIVSIKLYGEEVSLNFNYTINGSIITT
ncbi:MAG: hypothetical protein R3Y21_05160 [Mycoplasmatota bacterium]